MAGLAKYKEFAENTSGRLTNILAAHVMKQLPSSLLVATMSTVQAQKDKGFFAWMSKQRLYYGAVLTAPAAARVDAALAAAAPATRLQLLAAARLLYAIAQPEKCAHML